MMGNLLFILGTLLNLALAFHSDQDKPIRAIRVELRCLPFAAHYRTPVNITEDLLGKSFYEKKVIEDPRLIKKITQEINLIERPQNLTTESLRELRIYGIIQYSNDQSIAFLCSQDAKVEIQAKSYKGGENLISIVRTIFGDTDEIRKELPPDT